MFVSIHPNLHLKVVEPGPLNVLAKVDVPLPIPGWKLDFAAWWCSSVALGGTFETDGDFVWIYIIMVPNLLASTRGCILFPIACGLYGSWARSGGAVVWAGWTMLDNQNVTLTAGPQSPGYCRPLCASGSFEWLGENWDLRTVGFMVGPEKNFMNYSRFLCVYM